MAKETKSGRPIFSIFRVNFKEADFPDRAAYQAKPLLKNVRDDQHPITSLYSFTS
jgi:hypothetical protein